MRIVVVFLKLVQRCTEIPILHSTHMFTTGNCIAIKQHHVFIIISVVFSRTQN